MTKFATIEACVFDAYGTLFDVNAAAERCRAELGDKFQPLADLWRTKQLQYTWLRGMMGDHAPFDRVTADALDYGLAALKIDNKPLRDKLLGLYMTLDAYPEVKDALGRLKSAGKRLAILSNGSPRMLDAAVGSAGLAHLLDAVISVEDVKVFKPSPRVYRLAVERLGLPEGRMAFMSSNAWDACAAARFGFRVVWVNRFAQPRERLTAEPDAEIRNLSELPDLLA
jgi:2-haloacid dehalogenase